MSEDPLTECPTCREPSLKRKIGLGAGIIFKGGGFYETDFKDRKGSKPDASTDKEKSSSSEAKAAPASDSKPEKKTSAASE